MNRDPSPAIRLRGVRHNNLKGFDLDLPIGRLTVITGLSGSGKSSLAFDTLFAEGQRRYIETFSPYARQFFDRMDKPQVDRIEGIPPAVAIEQRNSVRSTRSTVGTMTELCDYLKLLWPHLAQLYCKRCRYPVLKEPPQVVWRTLMDQDTTPDGAATPEVLITFELPLSEKLPLKETFALIARQGYQRLLWNDEIIRLDDALSQISHHPSPLAVLNVVQDRLALIRSNRPRFIESCEQAYHFGQGKLCVHFVKGSKGARVEPGALARPRGYAATLRFSSGFHCARCDLDYREPTPALFSFNHPIGACPTCKGFGRVIGIDYDLAIPDRSRTLAQGAVRPWQSGMSAECQDDLVKFCKARKIPMKVPFSELSEQHRRWVIEGDPDYGVDEEHEWPRAWYGVKGYFRWLESKSYKMHVRVLLSRYRIYTPCPDCHGTRLKPEALLYRTAMGERPLGIDHSKLRPETANDSSTPAPPPSLTLPDLYALPVDQALVVIEDVGSRHSLRSNDPLRRILHEVRARLQYLIEVGLGYLTLDRPTRTLSGGETERVNLTTCLGTGLVNTLFVLDEPSVGLHPRDTARLVRILERLRDTGNTVVVVEHEPSVMRAADEIVDLGPGRGEQGGEVVFQGPVGGLLRSDRSLTGAYLSGRKQIEIPQRRPVGPEQPAGRFQPWENRSSAGEALALNEAALPFGDAEDLCPALRILNASRHNLKNLTVEIPLRRFVCLTGVSGSGKTTLVREVLLPALQARLGAHTAVKASDRFDSEESAGVPAPSAPVGPAQLTGWAALHGTVLVDQAPLGKTPRSNPAVYIGAFEDIRDLFAQTELARQRGLNCSAFSFNSRVGQCERCRGAGFEKIEMQFLSDVFIRCPECNGRRYRQHILEVKLRSSSSAASPVARGASREWSIADLLEATVDDAVEFLLDYGGASAGRRALARLKLLQEVGLGYLRLGQPINTLSGGESQRLKLVSHLAESAAAGPEAAEAGRLRAKNSRSEVKQWLADRSSTRAGRVRSLARDPSAGDQSFPAQAARKGTLFLFDEPTTGLHFDDVRLLLQVFQRLVDDGHSVLVIEHNLDVIKCADWIIDLGPEAGEGGGQLVAAGTPEDVAACEASHTGRFLREVLRAVTAA